MQGNNSVSEEKPETVPPSKAALAEALALSSEILRNIELDEISLTNIALKASRLARLLNHFDYQRIMAYEAGGYPRTPTGVAPDVWKLALAAGRRFIWTDPIRQNSSERIYVESIAELEAEIQMSGASLAAARDPDITEPAKPVLWAAPSFMPKGNVLERGAIRESAKGASSMTCPRFLYQS